MAPDVGDECVVFGNLGGGWRGCGEFVDVLDFFRGEVQDAMGDGSFDVPLVPGDRCTGA